MSNLGGRRGWPWLLLALVLFLAWRAWPPAGGLPPLASPTADASRAPLPAGPVSNNPTAPPTFLPPEAIETVALIQRGGPFPHAQDGSVFGNREGHLPRQPRGWYREYTVETPGLRHRGARRIVTGGDPPQAWYYTDDHYESFRRFDPGDPRP